MKPTFTGDENKVKRTYDIAAYIWPAYTGDEPRTKMFWQEGIGEWQSVKNSAPKENGYFWNRKPLWGYENEADPRVMEKQISEATKYGVNVFIYDWYWFDGRPFLEQCLNNGFLGAKNNESMSFYLMWANHDANQYWNIDLSDTDFDTVIWKGAVEQSDFESVVHRVIDKYFSRPNYYKINGSPVFMIYDIKNLINGLGGIENARKGIEYFREETKKAGFPDLHLQFAIKGERNSIREMISRLPTDSVSHYQFVHMVEMNRDYLEIIEDVKKEWNRTDREYSVPYFPNVSCGWDNNPRFRSFKLPVVKNNTPENFRKVLEAAKEYVDAHSEQPPLITVNAWNEWTETSYLEPDDLYGYGYTLRQ